ncbi:oligoketide cyclase [Anaplasma phagocytophilum str. MRK]|uniref:type II toxin-antitoxin system RatA family toxin n=1 Tax=Anaplasma phagocytophilum TaxID=948 RepID=UPI000533A6CE|nr:type II toxin-antitoxin system RatA family toxin [Anaplasma phagocytophilum]KDB56644.1 oligoketide cyclase [Anaplasma phagocytophilum str. MRK]
MVRARRGFSKSEVLSFPAKDIFSIVLDVEKYPAFLPWCKEVVILERHDASMFVKLVAQFMSLEGAYTSEVSFSAPTLENPGWIRAVSTDGVFNTLCSEWNFLPKNERETLVTFFVNFSFKNRMLQFAFDMASSMAISNISRAFKNRAYQLLK